MIEDLNTGYSLKKLLWLIPVILCIHNLEEALTMLQWMSIHLPLLQEKILFFDHLQFSTTQLYISLVSVSFFPLLLTLYCLRGEPSGRRITAMLTLQSIVFWNALVPHIGGLFLLGMYNPGAVTAILLNIPFSVYLFKRVILQGVITKVKLRNIIVAGLLLYLPIVYLNHLLAESVTKLLH